MSQNFRSRALTSVAAVAIVASGAVGAALYEGQPALAQTAKAPITVNAQAPATFADVVDQVKPAVVSVRVKVENAMTDGDGLPSSQLENVPPQLREFFRRFGENGMPGDDRRGPRQRREVRQGVGSGFLISADGYVVTNNHVVDGAKTVQVTTDDGRTLDAKVIGAEFEDRRRAPQGHRGRQLPLREARQGLAARRRLGGRDRQPVRPRRHGDVGHRLGARTRHRRRAL